MPRIRRFRDPVPCHIYHFAYCFRDTQTVSSSTGAKEVPVLRFNACCLPEPFTMYGADRMWLSNVNEAPGELWDYVVRLDGDATYETGVWRKTKTPFATATSTTGNAAGETEFFGGEFPTLHPYRHMQPARYTYMMGTAVRASKTSRQQDRAVLPFVNIAKFDRLSL